MIDIATTGILSAEGSSEAETEDRQLALMLHMTQERSEGLEEAV